MITWITKVFRDWIIRFGGSWLCQASSHLSFVLQNKLLSFHAQAVLCVTSKASLSFGLKIAPQAAEEPSE